MPNRYWIDDNPLERPFGEHTVALVDEEAGGVVAYVNDYARALSFLRHLQAA